jgi:hypothetical protein
VARLILAHHLKILKALFHSKHWNIFPPFCDTEREDGKKIERKSKMSTDEATIPVYVS